LRKNKHNNLTTIYYLASKGKFDGISEEYDKKPAEEKEKHEQSTGEQSNSED